MGAGKAFVVLLLRLQIKAFKVEMTRDGNATLWTQRVDVILMEFVAASV